MNKLLLLLLTSFLLTQSIWAEEHTNKEQGFALTPASGWTVKSEGLAYGTYLSVRAPGEDRYSPSILVYVWPGEQTIASYFEGQKMMLEGTADNLTFKNAELAGKKAGSYTYTVRDSLRTEAVYICHKGKTYVVNQTARIEKFSDEAVAFKQMVSSFRVLD